MRDEKPLLTIAIPTWNRSFYLEQTLNQLRQEVASCDANSIEVLVSDNFSSDNTMGVIEKSRVGGIDIKYVRNEENIGSDANIAQAFNMATGQYVLILGDDDLFVDGTLSWLLEALSRKEYGVVCLRPYGFDHDFRKEYPGNLGVDKEFDSSDDFLIAIGSLVTFISSCVINKDLLKHVDANDYTGGNLVQVHLIIQAALLGQINLYSSRYRVACTRNNSGGYDFFRVFVEELGWILDKYRPLGLSEESIKAFEMRMMVGFLPYYLLRRLKGNVGDIKLDRARMEQRFGARLFFRLWLAPSLYLPRPFAIVWSAFTTLVGRVIHGDLQRGLYFVWNKIFFEK